MGAGCSSSSSRPSDVAHPSKVLPHSAAPHSPAPPKLMISYRVKDTGAAGDGTAVHMAKYLRNHGFDVFLDTENLEGGDRWMEVIQKGVLGCDVFIALCSNGYTADDSPWTTKEFYLASDEGKLILPVYHSGLFPPPRLKLQLAGLNYVPKEKPLSKVSHRDSAMAEVMAAIHKLHGSLPDTKPAGAKGAAGSGDPEPAAAAAAAPDGARPTTFEAHDDLLKPYKKHLLASCFDLQGRLSQQVCMNFLHTVSQRGTRHRAYAVDSTVYFFANFFGWLELIRRQLVFLSGSSYAESVNAILDSIRFAFSGETALNGARAAGCAEAAGGDAAFDANAQLLQLNVLDLRCIGGVMLTAVDAQLRPLELDVFLPKLSADAGFKLTLQPLIGDVEQLCELEAPAAPVRRLALIQVLLCKLIDILDGAVPWDCGPKFDPSEEPRYIPRDMRLSPLVHKLSPMQKAYLARQAYFAEDPGLCFPGFREDLAARTQAERDGKLWLGACPARLCRRRPKGYLPPVLSGVLGVETAAPDEEYSV